MKVEGNKIILDAGESITIEAKSDGQVVPTPAPPSQKDNKISFEELVSKCNEVLIATDHNPMSPEMDIYGHLQWVYGLAEREWRFNVLGFYTPANYPDVYNHYGDDDSLLDTAYNAMQAWLMSMYLARVCPTFGVWTNTQTELFKLAYNIGGGAYAPLYGTTFQANPYVARIIAGKLFAYTSGNEMNDKRWESFRNELGGQMIPASCWDELLYKFEEIRDDDGWRKGFKTECIGWLVNTSLFIPSAPAPRVSGTTVCELPMPFDEGQNISQFNEVTMNYYEDERAYEYAVEQYNMMAQTPLSVWNSYPTEKQNRLINVMATPPCTYMFMFGAPKHIQLVLDKGNLPIVDGYPRYVFQECENSPLVLNSPFSDLAGIIRYNCDGQETIQESAIKTILDIADNCRFPTQDQNYGRCRSGCSPTMEGGERVSVHGAPENELYNVSISCMVADNDAQREKWAQEDGFAADSPKSYVSGHSAQIVAMALMLSELNPDKTNEYMAHAYEYSANRYIGRYHWLSDVIYGRIFGTIATSIIGAMDGLQDGLKSIKEWINNPTPQPQPTPQGDCSINIIIRNESGRTATLNGELCMVLANPDVNGVYYGWDGAYNRTGHITYKQGGIVLQTGEECRIYDVNMSNDDVVVRGRNLLGADLLPVSGRPSNVLLYDIDGSSENFVPTPVDSSIIFDDSVTIELVF